MDIQTYLTLDENEKPLQNLVSDGGMCRVFRTIGCIGDSLASGEFQTKSRNGAWEYHDYFEYSWIQYIARDAGLKAYNFTRGGMTASEYWNKFAEDSHFWDRDKLCQAYIIALGMNDLFGQHQELGSLDDISPEDYTKNKDTFTGYFARIIQRLKSMQPRARFFLVTIPKDGSKEGEQGYEIRRGHQQILSQLADFFDYTYLIDLFTYAPVYDEDFRRRFFRYGHMNPAGYVVTAKIIESYIDYIVRHHPEEFSQIGLIGTPFYEEDLPS